MNDQLLLCFEKPTSTQTLSTVEAIISPSKYTHKATTKKIHVSLVNLYSNLVWVKMLSSEKQDIFTVFTDILAGYEYSDNVFLFPACIWIDNSVSTQKFGPSSGECSPTFVFEAPWVLIVFFLNFSVWTYLTTSSPSPSTTDNA